MKKKTHKATAKRFKLTGSGKVKHNRQGDNAHLKANKTSTQKLRTKGFKVLGNKKEVKKIINLMSA